MNRLPPFPKPMSEHDNPFATPWELTGGYCYVRGLFGRLVLKVQEVRRCPDYEAPKGNPVWRDLKRWRKARYRDLAKLRELNGADRIVEEREK